MTYFQSIIPLLLAVAFIMTIADGRHRHFHWMLAFTGIFTSFFLIFLDFLNITKDKIMVHYLLGWAPPLGITFAMDLLNYTVVLLIIITAMCALMISRTEIQKEKKEFYTLFTLLFVGLMGASMTGDIFNLFVFFEILSIASYSLVSYNSDKGAIKASIKYLIMGSFSTSLILLGIALIYGSLGTLNMAHIAQIVSTSATTATLVGFGLIFSGFSFKAAVAPFHAWKPSVIKNTPLSLGLMLTVGGATIGLYTIFRLAVTVGNLNIASMLILLSFITMILGAVLALQTKDLKKLLAFSAISQTGYVLLGFGLGTYTGAIYHMINFVIIDILLFTSAYVIIRHFKTSNMNDMGGLGTGDKTLFISFVIATFSLAGLPLFNGFSSKLLIYLKGFEIFPLATLVAMLVSVLTLAYSFKMFNLIFLSNNKEKNKPINIEQSIRNILIIFAVLCILLGVFQAQFTDLIEMIANSGLDRELYIKTVLGLN